MIATMIWIKPPKKKATGITIPAPAGFSRCALYMPSMNDVAANAVTAHAAGLAMPGWPADA